MTTQNKNPITVRTGRDHYRTEIKIRDHLIFADEPTERGGTNLGPTPTEYMAAALGSCISITLRMYADRKEWPLEDIIVNVSHERLMAKDCEECESESGKVDRIEVELEFTGPLDDKQIARLMQIAGKCPVHRSFLSETIIKKTLKK